MHDIEWVFGYGSLMWRPGFQFLERRQAHLAGAHRRLCVLSHVHRGTPGLPGLVLGLDRGGSCHGIAYRVARGDWEATLDYLRAREQVTMVYREAVRPVRLDGAGKVPALTYMVDHGHAQYAGALSIDEQLRLVRQGHGQSGPNVDYVRNTHAHLDELGIHDAPLSALIRELDR